MPAPFPQPRIGKPVKNSPSGFPQFFDQRRPRVLAADPWAFLRHLAVRQLAKEHEPKALAHIDQAFDFCEAAQNPQIGSKPLLYYYSFLNLVKVALLLRKVSIPVRTYHGIFDPGSNRTARMRLEGQQVQIEGHSTDHSKMLPEFVKILDGDASKPRTVKIVELLSQIPSVNRTFVQVTEHRSIFLPLHKIQILGNHEGVWSRFIVKGNDRDVAQVLPDLKRRKRFKNYLYQVVSDSDEETWFETKIVHGRRRGIDNAIQHLAQELRTVGIYTILAPMGYRFYLANLSPSSLLPQLAAAHALMFYLGSITRYQPDAFDKILGGKYSWVVEEFITTQPRQFLYTLASELAGVDVVRPFSVQLSAVSH